MKVVITDYQYDNVDQERKIITDAGFTLETFQAKNPADIIPIVKDADAVITQYGDINREVIMSMEKCKIIIKYGIGINNIDTKAATEKGVFVCNVPDYGIDEVSNQAISFIMALAKKLPIINKAFSNGEWSYDSIVPLFRMAGQTLGLVGFGRIPQMVAHKMANFDMKIVVYDPFVDEVTCKQAGVEKVDFNTLLSQSDYISLHCPLTEDTLHLFGDEAFRKMKNTAFIVNTARGPVIDEESLILALKNKEISGAGLDVFEEEPLNSESPLLTLENVIATPHCSWYSEESIGTLQKKVALEAVNVLNGGLPYNLCNKDVVL